MRTPAYRIVVKTAIVLMMVSLVNDQHQTSPSRAVQEAWLSSLYRSIPVGSGDRERFDNPARAAFRDYIMTMDPATRQVPRKAWLHTSRLVEKRSETALKSGEKAFNWISLRSNTGGRTRALMYDPNDTTFHKVWAGSVTGGLWYNNDVHLKGSWVPVDDFWPSLSVSCICYDPNDTKTFYLGTGEGQTAVIIYRESTGRGTGIWKSTDAGGKWELLPSTEDFEYVTDIKVRNEDSSSVIYAAVTSGIYKGEIHSSSPSDGLYRSVDGGQSWMQVLPDIPGKSYPYAPSKIEIGPGGRMFVGTMRNVFHEGGGRILYSDDGSNWTVIDDYVDDIESRQAYNLPGRVVLAPAPSDENRVYAVLSGGQQTGNGFVYSRGVMMIKSDDGGESWNPISMPDETGDWSFLAWHALVATVHPDDPNEIWVGGLDLYRSRNGGLFWQKMSLWYNYGAWYHPDNQTYVHADQHSLVFSPGNPDELLNANDGGVFLTTEAGIRDPVFTEKNRQYNTLQYYTCAIHPEAGNNYFLGGCQDNGTFRITTGPTSKENAVSGGDGTFCFIDENQPWLQISGSQYNNYYFSSDGNHEEIRSQSFYRGIFINPVDYDHISNVLYANGMTETGEHSDRFIRIRPLADTAYGALVYLGTRSNTPFSAIKVLPWKKDGNTTVYAGSQSGRLFRIDNAQDMPKSTEIGSDDFPAGNISCIEPGITEARMLVTFSNYRVPHVWQTTDHGMTWTDKSGNLPDMPVRWAVYSPYSISTVLLATEMGIWYTENINQDPVTWVQSTDMPNVRVDMIRTRKSDGQILAATHGRGLFLSSGLVGLNPVPSDINRTELTVFPNPVEGLLRFALRSDFTGELTLQVADMSGRIIHQENILKREPELRHEIDLENLWPGTYIISTELNGHYISKRFIKK